MHRRLSRLTCAAAIIAAAFGVSVPTPVSAQARAAEWTASEDDYLLLQLTLGKYTLGHEIRGYQTQ